MFVQVNNEFKSDARLSLLMEAANLPDSQNPAIAKLMPKTLYSSQEVVQIYEKKWKTIKQR